MSGSASLCSLGSPSIVLELKECSVIQVLIKYIQEMIQTHFDLLKVVERPEMLVEALEELDCLIEMHDIKKAIVKQIQLMMILAYRRHLEGKCGSKFDGHMLHGVIYGPPGVGKSTAARCVAKIFYAIGVLDQMATNARTCASRPAPKLTTPKPVVELSVDSVAHEAGELLMQINKFRHASQDLIAVHQARHPEEIDMKPHMDAIMHSGLQIGLKATNILTLCQTHGDYDDESEELSASYPIATQTAGVVRLPLIPPGAATLHTTTPFNPVASVKPEIPPKSASTIPVVICGRTEFVGEYAGQTTPKANKFLMDNRGKVIVVEESYLLYTGDKDQFGMEALTEINRFMDEHASEIIIYFTGYKELMEETIFKAQPGLKRRCEQVFNIKGYTASGLAKIFKSQLEKDSWSVDPCINLERFFERQLKEFKAYGGDTLKLAFQCKQAFSSRAFDKLYTELMCERDKEAVLPAFMITEKLLLEAFVEFQAHQIVEKELPSPPFGMYL